MRKVEPLPTQHCEAGYGSGYGARTQVYITTEDLCSIFKTYLNTFCMVNSK